MHGPAGACPDRSISMGIQTLFPHQAPPPPHAEPPQWPSVCLISHLFPRVLLGNRGTNRSKHCPNNPDSSDQGSVNGQVGGFQPFTLRETESLRDEGGLAGQAGQPESGVLSPGHRSTKFLNRWARNRGPFCPPGDFGNVYKLFWFSHLAGEEGVVLPASGG